MNPRIKIQLYSFLVPIVYALYLFNNLGEENNSLLFYIFLVFKGLFNIKIILLTIIISYLGHHLHIKKNINAFGFLDILGLPKFLEKFYMQIDITVGYLISIFISYIFYIFNTGNFINASLPYSFIFALLLFWIIFNYNVSAFLFNWIQIVKQMKKNDM